MMGPKSPRSVMVAPVHCRPETEEPGSAVRLRLTVRILRDIEGMAALNELRALQSIGNKPGKVSFRAQLQGLAKFAPIFSAPDFQFGVWQYPPPEPSGIINLPYCELSDGAGAFVQAAYIWDG